MIISIKKITFLIIILASTNIYAAILDKDEVDNADLTSLQNETILFQSIGMGIALSIAQCDGVEKSHGYPRITGLGIRHSQRHQPDWAKA